MEKLLMKETKRDHFSGLKRPDLFSFDMVSGHGSVRAASGVVHGHLLVECGV